MGGMVPVEGFGVRASESMRRELSGAEQPIVVAQESADELSSTRRMFV